MSKKSVLLITPFFAPQSHAAVFRMFKMVKYLPDHGIDVHVVTTDSNYNYKEDPGLFDQLPENVKIHRATYIEPTLRGLKKMPQSLFSRDAAGKDFAQLSGASSQAIDSASKPSFMKKSYHWVRDNHLFSPDRFWPWVIPATNLALKVSKEHDIQTCITSCYPFSTNLIGLALKKSGLKWIADFRDPITFCHRTRSDIDSVFNKQRKIERLTFENADVVTGLGFCYRLIYTELYPDLQRMVFIPTGLDENLIPQSEVKPTNDIVFCGEYLNEYDGRVFELFKTAIEKSLIPNDCKIKIVGYRNINEPRLLPKITPLNLGDRVEFIDHMPQSKLYEMLKGAKAGMLNPGAEATWWNNFAKLVDFIALNKRVLAVVPNPSEARTELSKAGLGIFLDGPEEEDLEKLVTLFKTDSPAIAPNQSRYLARTMVSEFAQLI